MTIADDQARRCGWSFWIDRGGTFTDVIGRDGAGQVRTLKLLSVSEAYDDAAVEGMRRMLGCRAGEPFPAERVASIRMGTTWRPTRFSSARGPGRCW